VNALTFPSFCKFLFAFFSHRRIGPIWRTCFQNTPKVSIKRHIFSFSFIQKQKHKVFDERVFEYNLFFLFFLCLSHPYKKMLAVILCTGNHFDFFLPLAMTSKLLIGSQAIRSVNIFHFFSVVFCVLWSLFRWFFGWYEGTNQRVCVLMNSYFSIFMLMLFYREMFSIFLLRLDLNLNERCF